ncbi:hypothetical protein CSV80_05885 [Sporosarcina sp. P12(2017)]|uniref:hypothetical protein n=1 Tax=unclassified Sporosarcina TaxID=2647733 RepID=UPI000C166E73|nr:MULTISPECIES: hypothetical protein [unclassified Sporosarcina]PIC57838.1 hypothetical protein CSV81_06030 [Sporosarcina sp. P10]PIC61220.1 hypothetical protein CSV80_05885 [Sporosarcina sp. P12(2017)]
MRESEKQIAKLALLGESIGLFGQAITTLAAYLALVDEETEEDKFIKMQRQIDDLLSEIRQKK